MLGCTFLISNIEFQTWVDSRSLYRVWNRCLSDTTAFRGIYSEIILESLTGVIAIASFKVWKRSHVTTITIIIGVWTKETFLVCF